MKAVVGLGNYASEYEGTRHNIGFHFIDYTLQQEEVAPASAVAFAPMVYSKKLNARVAKVRDTIYAKPCTYMNICGKSVASIVNFYNVSLDNLHIVHDDLDLEIGAFKHSFGSSSAGHRGVESIMASLGSQDFWRLRIGIGRPLGEHTDVSAYVLAKADEEVYKTFNSIPKIF